MEDIKDVIEDNPDICGRPVDIECRIEAQPGYPFANITNQEVTCDLENGLVCDNDLSKGMICYDYEIRIRCCHYVPCGSTTKQITTETTTASEYQEIDFLQF